MTGGDTDTNMGALTSPACTRHRNYIGGGKPTPPTMTPVQHTGPLASAERASSRHRLVRQRGGEEAPPNGRMRDVGECGEGLPG